MVKNQAQGWELASRIPKVMTIANIVVVPAGHISGRESKSVHAWKRDVAIDRRPAVEIGFGAIDGALAFDAQRAEILQVHPKE